MAIDLSSTYLGLKIRSPLVASSGPFTGSIENLKRLSDAGVGAVVLPSLFEEQIDHEASEWERLSEHHTEAFAEGLSYLPDIVSFGNGPQDYLQLLRSAKNTVDVPVIASLNGQRLSGWTRYAKNLEQEGADAIELNVYRVVTDPALSASQVEDEYVELVAAVCAAVSIPVAVKLGSLFTALPHFARRLEDAGASGLVLFNRFLHPEIDLEELTVTPHLTLSTPAESLHVIRWIAILRDHLSLSLAATSGVHSATDVVKLLLVGADVVMMTSALLKMGPEHLQKVSSELESWLTSHDYDSVEQMKGSMTAQNSADPAGFERANYMQALMSYTNDVF